RVSRPGEKAAGVLAEQPGEKPIPQPEVLFLPLDLGAEGLRAVLLKEVGNGNHNNSSARAQGGHRRHLAPPWELYPKAGPRSTMFPLLIGVHGLRSRWQREKGSTRLPACGSMS